MENRIWNNTLKKLFEGPEERRKQAVESITNFLESGYKTYYRTKNLKEKEQILQLINESNTYISGCVVSGIERRGKLSIAEAIRDVLEDKEAQCLKDAKIYSINKSKEENVLNGKIKESIGKDISKILSRVNILISVEQKENQEGRSILQTRGSILGVARNQQYKRPVPDDEYVQAKPLGSSWGREGDER